MMLDLGVLIIIILLTGLQKLFDSFL
jgi:hypothetical protein